MSRHYSTLVATMKVAATADALARDVDALIVPHLGSIAGVCMGATEWEGAAVAQSEAEGLLAQAQDIARRLRTLRDQAREQRPH
jgi:hypothetical protein